ncbi:MAG: diguanylate cyclase [Actinobacteria bacterium]|nr:diguanylate cyclase [Actinomycetota bacterium]
MSDTRSRRLLGEEAQTKFKRFEALVVATGSAAIVITAVLSYMSSRSLLEFAGQLLMLPVLLIAIQYGRIGAILSALFATGIYAVARSPELSDYALLTIALELLGVRAFGYFVIGFVGGEVMTAIKYYFAKSGGLGGIDQESGVYVSAFIKGMIEREVSNFERYEGVFSVVLIKLFPEELRQSSKFKTGRSLRGIGAVLKNNVRLVDEVGRIEDHSFALLLPHTSLDGARVVAERVARLVSAYYDRPARSGVFTTVYTVPDNLEELRLLVGLAQPTKSAGSPTNVKLN